MIEAAHDRARALMQSVPGLMIRVEMSNAQRGQYGLHVKAALRGESLTLHGRGYRFIDWQDLAGGADVAAAVDDAAREAMAARAAGRAAAVARGLVIR